MELLANNVWMMICTALVFFMHTGFAFLEIGLTRKKKMQSTYYLKIFLSLHQAYCFMVLLGLT